LPSRTVLKKFILKIFKEQGFRVERINYVFCSDSYLLTLNQNHLAHNTYTDILTFHYSENSQPVLSDIFISIDRIRENARVYNVSFLEELYRVIIHGALHLCDYDDKKKEDSSVMRSMENEYLRRYVPREK